MQPSVLLPVVVKARAEVVEEVQAANAVLLLARPQEAVAKVVGQADDVHRSLTPISRKATQSRRKHREHRTVSHGKHATRDAVMANTG